jgi:glycosyl hydrolase family 2/outer membrane putative beta-barrel porin/alpha-amylase
MIEETTSPLLEDSGNFVNRTVSELTPFSYSSKRLNHCGARKRAHVAGKFLFIGDEKFYVKGVNYGAFRPDPEKREYRDADQTERDFAQMKAYGINTVRIPHTTPPRSLLDAALRHGLRVMVGLSAEQYVGYLVDTQKARPDIDAIVREKVRTIQGHPGLLCYCIGNEIAAPVARWLGRRRVERYLRSLHDAIKTEDPEGIVTYVNEDVFGDTTVRFKINFLCNESEKLGIGLLSVLKIPTGTGNHVWERHFLLPVNYSLPQDFTLFAKPRIDILDQAHSNSTRVQWQNSVGLSHTIIGKLSWYVEFCDIISSELRGDTLGTGFTYQITPRLYIDTDSFFGLTASVSDYNVFTSFSYTF